MKDKIFTALKTEFKNLGFSDKALQGHANSLAATGLITDENLDAIVKGQKEALSAFQSEIDTRVTTAVDKAKKEAKKATGGDDDEPEKKNDPKPKDGETPEQKAIREMQAKLSAMESGKKNADLTAKARATMTEKKLPKAVIEMAMQGRTFEKEEDIETFVNQVEESHKQYVQELNDQGLGQSYNPPPSQATPAQKVESDISKWAEETTPAKK